MITERKHWAYLEKSESAYLQDGLSWEWERVADRASSLLTLIKI